MPRKKRKKGAKKPATEIKVGHLTLPMYSHQEAAYELARQHKRLALLMEQGTGKTMVAIGSIGHRYLDCDAKRFLVVAPLSVIPTWESEIAKFANFPYTVLNLTGLKDAKRIELLNRTHPGAEIALINYEATWRFFNGLDNWEPDMIICDESQRIKNPRAKQSKAMHKLGLRVPYKMILTGTPVTQSPLDLWSQYRFLAPEVFGYSFAKFRDRYAVMGGYGGYEVISYKHLDELAEKAYSCAFRVTKAEALDLPPEVNQERYVRLHPSATLIYRQLEDDLGVILSSGDTVTVPIILTQLLRLQQITGGFASTDQGRIERVDTAKVEEVKSICEDLSQEKKVVIFARFVPEIEALARELTRAGRGVVTLYGKTKDRGKVVDQFQNDPETTVIIAQIQSGGLGITLTAADTAIFYSTTFSYADYEQAKARIHRVGQESTSVNYIHLLAQGTIDEDIYEALLKKKDVADYVIEKRGRN